MIDFHELKTVCRTDGCPNSNNPVNVRLSVNADGNIWVFCGNCQNRVTDIEVVSEWQEDSELLV